MKLARRLKRETRPEHDLAEATRFAKAFFAGRFNANAYTLGLSHFEPIYRALEDALASPADPILSPFHRPAMFRLPAIQTDLKRFAGPKPVESAYAERIRTQARDNPVALLGHVYVRYFADLSGVARVAPIANRLLGIPKSRPLAYFRFDDIPDKRLFKKELRARLNAVPAVHHDVILDEARMSFRLHREVVDVLFETLDRAPAPRRV
ncbi:MAG: biliverdin-producing heme oxygenase [Myxococcota bacterium]